MTSPYITDIVAKAKQEYQSFHKFKEYDDPLLTRIKNYYSSLALPFNSIKTPWSAVFISWVMQNHFHIRHSIPFHLQSYKNKLYSTSGYYICIIKNLKQLSEI